MLLNILKIINLIKFIMGIKKICYLVFRYLVLTALYYPLAYLMFFLLFYFSVTYHLGYEPDSNGLDPYALHQRIEWFETWSLEIDKWSNFLLFSIMIILIYVLIFAICRKNLLKINKIHFYMLLITFFLYLLSIQKIGWYVD
ncbi:hypothetical protein IO90_08350 [Chryseobacterium sp. FH1]|nr:hypothetical protein IO90_08350 [Chryseobacterium sp. FH1]